jgi:hypothetical protein
MKAPPPPQNVSSVEPFRSTVKKLHDQAVEMAAIHERLEERGYRGSYASVVRFAKGLDPVEPETTSRVETPPGEEMQIDFGYAGRMRDEAWRLLEIEGGGWTIENMARRLRKRRVAQGTWRRNP